ncbi:ferritin-like domain-containing protein [Chitiniphilus purpureus]|uniref:Ferritin-like domain-containing protein n=1 Tax=Chitiniphilus purpureus TaxID=2981137 RepID=A0ABY6DIG4_9NEIS|nr:ferritin-like domain-containing protein [Chitiniphilus sp. CD1]UXY14028.1 ferritin-like domain-containing protein [Chitiniphilus sp. CD1]
MLSPTNFPAGYGLRQAAYTALVATDPDVKMALLAAMAPTLPIEAALSVHRLPVPGRPARPLLVEPQQLVQRNVASDEGRAALLHAIAHIEFNAINLALDAIYRFDGMPSGYYIDWLQVACEEALHFSLLVGHLATLGHAYGDFPAHNGLWDMALKTDHDVMVRMALVPRILEARGLDVTPGIQQKLRQAGDARACEILDVILRDEIGHVRIGNRWYHWCCAQRGLEPVANFVTLLRTHEAPPLKGRLNYPARRAAGFSSEELALIESLKG